MTETLTYDPTPADAPELSDEEKNSLEVAEKLGQEESELILGKFKNAEELEKAYVELEKKQGTEDEVEETVDEEPDEQSPGVSLITSASDEYFANEGKLSQDTMDKFTEMSSKDLVAAYMEIQAKNPDVQNQVSAPDLTDAEVNSIMNSVGGDKAYDTITNWARDNLEDKQLDAFNTLINSGNATAIQLAVNGLKSEYETANGYEGRMLTGKAAQSSGDVFRSQAEVVKAMSDSRYEKDPAYRKDIYDKLERSDLAF